MGRGSQPAEGSATQSQNTATGLTGNATSLYSNLAPGLEAQAAAPSGFSPADEASMETGAEENAAGSGASAIGAGNLAAARTRNAGGFGQAVSDASRGAGETLSRGLLGARNANAELKQHQRDSAVNGLEGLYGTNVGGANTALGNVAANVNADTNAENASWDAFNNITGALSNAAKAASGFKPSP